MCGLAGAIGRIDDSVLQAVRRMHGAQPHRGPDGEGFWSSAGGGADQPGGAPSQHGVILAHRRLAIIDLSPEGAHPMLDTATGNVVMLNGEIYNYLELKAELSKAGATFRTRTDTEVILKAYAHWGKECVKRFRGMFTFVLWDVTRREAFVARDRLGIKPLYWYEFHHPGGDRTMLFASEVRSLLASGLVPRRLDPTGVDTYLWNGFVVGPGSIVEKVSLMPAGTMVTVDATGRMQSPEPYWSLPPASSGGTVESLEEELLTAVKLRLISDVPLGVFLSGGVDSSAVTALAVRASTGTIKTFNISFDEAAFDESRYASAVAKALGTEHHDIRLTQLSFKNQMDAALGCIDQPTFDAINTYFVSRAVREAGLTVALAGTGGDELFGGYRSFRDIPRSVRASTWASLMPGGLRRMVARAVMRMKTGHAGAVPPQTRWGKLDDVLACRGDLVGTYQVHYGLFTQEFQRELHAAARASTVASGLPTETLDAWHAMVAKQPMLHAISMLELSSFITQRLMRDTDCASMAVSLEARVPLLDHRVVECVAAMDEHTRFSPLGRKMLLRHCALSNVDRAIFDRPKSGFVLPIEGWSKAHLRVRVDGCLRDSATCAAVGLNAAAVNRLWQAYQQGSPGLYWSRIWSLFILLDWCRTHKMALA